MKWLPISVLALMLTPVAVLAATPGLPNQFYGTVSYDSGTTPAGLTVRALAGSNVISTSVTASNGQYGVTPDLLIVANQTAGATILFTVNSAPARETVTFANGKLTNLNLSVPGAAPSSGGSTGGSSATATGGGGGGGGASTIVTAPAITTATATLTTEEKIYDSNNDNHIDVLDFNALMVHWGEKGATVGDFDGNGTVDVFDFNALMVHWTA